MAKASNNEMAHLSMMNGNMTKSAGHEFVSLSEREQAQRTLTHNLKCFMEQTPLKMVSPLPALKKDLERMTQLSGQWSGQIETLGKMIEDTQSERENLLNRAVREAEVSRGRTVDSRRGKPRPAHKNTSPKLQTGDAVALNMLLKKEFELNQKLRESQEQLEKVTQQKAMLEVRLQTAEDMSKTAVMGYIERVQRTSKMLRETCMLMRYVQTDLDNKVKESLAKMENTHGASASFITNPIATKLDMAKMRSASQMANFQQLQTHYEQLQSFLEANSEEYLTFIKIQYLVSAPPMTQQELNALWENLLYKILTQLNGNRIAGPLSNEQLLPYEQVSYELKTLVSELAAI